MRFGRQPPMTPSTWWWARDCMRNQRRKGDTPTELSGSASCCERASGDGCKLALYVTQQRSPPAGLVVNLAEGAASLLDAGGSRTFSALGGWCTDSCLQAAIRPGQWTVLLWKGDLNRHHGRCGPEHRSTQEG